MAKGPNDGHALAEAKLGRILNYENSVINTFFYQTIRRLGGMGFFHNNPLTNHGFFALQRLRKQLKQYMHKYEENLKICF